MSKTQTNKGKLGAVVLFVFISVTWQQNVQFLREVIIVKSDGAGWLALLGDFGFP